MQEDPLKTLSSRIAYKNPWITIREDAIKRPDGSEGIYGVMESRDSVMVVVRNDKNEIYLINAFSYPSRSWNWELPGGGGDNEHHVEASKRELQEETGITATDWQLLGKTRVCNGFMTEKMYSLLAQSLTFGEKALSDDTEMVREGRFFSQTTIRKMVASGEINDGQSLAALYLFDTWQRNNNGTKEN